MDRHRALPTEEAGRTSWPRHPGLGTATLSVVPEQDESDEPLDQRAGRRPEPMKAQTTRRWCLRALRGRGSAQTRDRGEILGGGSQDAPGAGPAQGLPGRLPQFTSVAKDQPHSGNNEGVPGFRMPARRQGPLPRSFAWDSGSGDPGTKLRSWRLQQETFTVSALKAGSPRPAVQGWFLRAPQGHSVRGPSPAPTAPTLASQKPQPLPSSSCGAPSGSTSTHISLLHEPQAYGSGPTLLQFFLEQPHSKYSHTPRGRDLGPQHEFGATRFGSGHPRGQGPLVTVGKGGRQPSRMPAVPRCGRAAGLGTSVPHTLCPLHGRGCRARRFHTRPHAPTPRAGVRMGLLTHVFVFTVYMPTRRVDPWNGDGSPHPRHGQVHNAIQVVIRSPRSRAVAVGTRQGRQR